MDKENKKLLEDVIKQRLEQALDLDECTKESNIMFTEAMSAVDKSIELSKLEAARDEQIQKQELAIAEAKKDRIVKCVEIGAAIILAPVINTMCNKAYAKIICHFEKDYTFTTTAGRSLSRLFNFKNK